MSAADKSERASETPKHAGVKQTIRVGEQTTWKEQRWTEPGRELQKGMISQEIPQMLGKSIRVDYTVAKHARSRKCSLSIDTTMSALDGTRAFHYVPPLYHYTKLHYAY